MTNNDTVMSLSVISTADSWQAVRTLEGIFVGSSEIDDSSLSGSMKMPGRLEISESGVSLPEQELEVLFLGDDLVIKNLPAHSGPEFLIRMPLDSSAEGARHFQFLPSDKTVEGGILFTRMVFALVKAGRGALNVYGIEEPLRFSVRPLPESEMQKLLYRAKLFRKLQYIERVFGVKFALPEEVPSEVVKNVEIVFRGITEGAFSMREPQATFRISPQDIELIDLNAPPFFGPGQFDASVADEITLFDQRLEVGPITVHIEKAELANPSAVKQIKTSSKESVVVRFEILDNQLGFRFEDYIKQASERLAESLERFKQELNLKEPKELVDLISEPLARDVSSFEAAQIAVGWTLYNDLPDRYCPQEPEFDSDLGRWRVPIYLVYANGEGGPVGEIIIDAKTGVIISYTPLEELRSKGLALAEQILHA